jgi:hypothetical protein
MVIRTIYTLIAAGLLFMSSWTIAPTALAITPITLSDLSYKDCSPEAAAGVVTSGGMTQGANCFVIVGKAENKSNKAVYDVDVFGRIYDADNNNVLPNRGRVGLIDRVAPGISDFEMRITVPENLSQPLQLKKFKASGFSTKIRQ